MELYFRMFAYGLRMLVKKPTVMIVAVLMLALGVGANTAILECFYGRGGRLLAWASLPDWSFLQPQRP